MAVGTIVNTTVTRQAEMCSHNTEPVLPFSLIQLELLYSTTSTYR